MSFRHKALVLASSLAMSAAAGAATCPDGTQCSGAHINNILVNWNDGSGPYSVKVRFDFLAGLTCNTFGSNYNEVKLLSTDPAFESKYAMLLSAQATGRLIWFTISNPIGSAGNPDGTAACQFQMIAT
ncbi:hypothetical protein [Dyella koreensis]|uniref:Uncharacterized protein n=1 Tax=Dyella koreensis TaxID=311235 RepID=A0ABW8JZQ8_9GAMM